MAMVGKVLGKIQPTELPHPIKLLRKDYKAFVFVAVIDATWQSTITTKVRYMPCISKIDQIEWLVDVVIPIDPHCRLLSWIKMKEYGVLKQIMGL